MMNGRSIKSKTAFVILCPVLFTCLVLAGESKGAESDIPWDKDTEDFTLISMGPIGARAKTDHLLENLPESHSNSGVIKYIYENSPAQGKLQLEDAVVGVNGKPFNKDFSRRLGEAIDQSGTTGKLSLSVRRGGKPLTVVFDVPKIGSFSKTFPYACKKSDAVLEAACDWLARHQWSNGKLEADARTPHCVLTAVAGMAWLGSGNPKYQKNIEAVANNLLDFFTKERTSDGNYKTYGMATWHIVYGAMFLSEYYLATGDPRVLPVLGLLSKDLEHAQFRSMDAETVAAYTEKFKGGVPPYWFGRARLTTKDVPNDTYFHLGINTANALVAWQLMSECGAPVDRNNVTHTIDYIEKVASPGGQMSYAGSPGQLGTGNDAFGRTGVLAVFLHLQNDRPQYARKVVGIFERDYKDRFLISHNSAVMGEAWASLGIAALEPKLFRTVADHFKYDFDLTRLPDGSFVANPSHWASGKELDFAHTHRWTTAYNAFFFTLSQRRLRIAGGSPRMFGVDPATLKGDTLAAFRAMQSKDYPAAITKLRTIVPPEKKTGELPSPAERLLNCVSYFAASDWQQIETLSKKKDAFMVWNRLSAYEKAFGKLSEQDQKITEMKAACNTPESKSQRKIGQAYYAILNNPLLSKARMLAELERFAGANATSPYAAMAQDRLRELKAPLPNFMPPLSK